MAELANSTYLDFTSTGTLPASVTNVADAYQLTGVGPATTGLVVGIILERANDPATLLSSDWGTRQATLAQMEADGTLWSTFGADAATFASVQSTLQGMGLTIVGDASGANGYVTSAESRTIWVELDPTDFATLFGTTLMVGQSANLGQVLYWDGNLNLPDSISGSLAGLWPDFPINAATANLTDATVTLPQGAQGQGNSSGDITQLFPQDIAAAYNFPLSGTSVETGTLGIIEPYVGDAVTDIATYGTFEERVNAYLQTAGVNATADFYVSNRENQYYEGDAAGERSLDVAVVSTVVPNSRFGLYVGSSGTVYTAYQTAIWDTANNPGVLSSSWSDGHAFSADSPFAVAYRELFVDAALRGVSVFNDAYDGGSGNETETGLTNLFAASMSAYTMVVGGTSLSTVASADVDVTLSDVIASAQAGNLGTIWQLVRGGLTQWSSSLSDQSVFIETAWNQYILDGTALSPSYVENAATSGGVDTTQPTPGYQSDYGLTPTTVNPGGGTGRGAPDVAANAGGNMEYTVPDENMRNTVGSGGTSAATPLWASLATQINAVFQDQGLPTLGYSNDLYYIASAIAPASFNDITMGNNISSYISGTDYQVEKDGTVFSISATGYGYEATEGYDLVSGLGTPNGVLLTRALSTIAHSQLYYDLAPVLENDAGIWGADGTQNLIFQSSFSSAESWMVDFGDASMTLSGGASGTFAWTAALAQQSLQSGFSADLVTMFDGYAQGQVYQTTVNAGTDLSITVGGAATGAYQSALTADYGFMDFVTASGASVEVARSVATATTASGLDDMDVVVRLRQNGVNDVSVLFYQVDDYAGTINGLNPGDAGYAAAAAARGYETSEGSSLSGDGYGAYKEGRILDVDAGDLIAMQLTSNGNTFWAFSQANEQVNGQGVAHLWSYGLNTWGWEDLHGGGDRDYNDLIVQLDFTSASGSGWLL
ncbi:DUF4114 domain-containing protein [Aquabacter cavernae]|uniref:DUF4114 domain-containing protein n=1 Tax=Aquabacter cavernae TaxID=2496029 RepID=UPI000F8E0335|nr:DUF4114 domain-containing protein [Aquabacter cavernae]